MMAVLVLALLSPAAMATDLKIDDSVHSDWMTVEGTWLTETSSSSKYGNNYLYCNQSPDGANSVTYTPSLPPNSGQWEVYIWYTAGLDRSSQAEVTIRHAGGDNTVFVNQQQNGGQWVYLGSYWMPQGTSSHVRISNRGTNTNKIVVADAVRFYSSTGDRLPPIISGIGANPGARSAIITWYTDEPATSRVEFGATSNYGRFSDLCNALVTSHAVSITDLTPETLYHYRVISMDGAGNERVSEDGTFWTGPEDNDPPVIQNVVHIPGANSAVIEWDTTEPATSQIEYGETIGYGNTTPLKTQLVSEHRVSIRELNPDTVYYYKVISVDGAGNPAVPVEGSFTTTSADTTPPVISGVRVEPQPNSAVVLWDTDEYATSRVEYGTTSAYGNTTATDLELVREHAVSLANLEPLTTYHYRVISEDGSGNSDMSEDHTFTTPAIDDIPPVISNVKATSFSGSCVITWTTNEASTSRVRFGLTDALGMELTDADLVTGHSVTLTGLAPSTKYYYRVESCDARGNCSSSEILSFNTKAADTTPPTITGIHADPASNSAIITWMTSEPATSQVAYGLTSEYGSSTIESDVLVTDHRVVITGLQSGTVYHFRVISRDGEGNESAPNDNVFETEGPDLTPPAIFNITVSRNVNSAIVRWQTNEPATSQVEYGETAAYGSQSPEDADLVTMHSVTLTGLATSTVYHFRVKSSDGAGNQSISDDRMFSTSAVAPEYRMIWADSWHNGFLTPEETTNFVNTVAAANYNAIVVEVRKAGDAYYLSDYEPWASNLNPANYDALQDLINKAHAVGIEVHAWIVTYRAWHKSFPTPPVGHVWREHGPGSANGDWSMRNVDNGYEEGSNLNIDPGVPGVQDYIANIVKDIVTKYPQLDGVNFDYIRYPGIAWGYNEITKQRFQEEFGYPPPTSTADPNWGVWCDYRRQQVTDLVRKCFVEAMHINPRIKMSVDTVGWEGPDPSADYMGTPQYQNVFQDARGWMESHIIDINILMNYKREFNATQKPNYRLWADWLPTVANATGRLAVDGQGVYLNSIPDSITQMRYSRNAGADGLCSYSYAVTNRDSDPAEDFFNAVRINLYSQPAPVPDMPWKTEPATGIIFGTITDAGNPDDDIYQDRVYKATVTLSGPIEKTTLTDATGTYAFLDLPPGTYTLAISKTGYEPRVFGGIDVAAGDVLRRDAAIEGTARIVSPPGAVKAGWNLISLPVQPKNPDPLVVFDGFYIDAMLYRWDNPTQSLICFSEWDELFGSVNVSDGYWLQTDTAGAIIYEPADGDPPATPSIHIPRTGWSIIGCPSTTPRDWNMTEVSNGLTTVPIVTARDLHWLDTICYWWENTGGSGSLKTLGLDDDWTDATVLQPWHGYWLKTGIDDLRIILH